MDYSNSPLKLVRSAGAFLNSLLRAVFPSRLTRNTIMYTLGLVLPQAASFLLLPITTRFLTTEDYGIIGSMSVMTSILGVVMGLGIGRSIFRLYYDYGTVEEKRNFLGTITISLLVISTFIVGLLFIFNHYVSLLYKSIPFFPYFVYVILTGYLTMFRTVPLAYFQITEQPQKFTLLTIGQFLLNISLILWFVVGLGRGAEGQLGAQLAISLLFTPLYIFILYKIINLKFNWEMMRNSLSFSLPLVPSLITAWILNLSDRVFIERYFTLSEVGLYSLGYQLGQAVTIISTGMNRAFGPFFYRLANAEDQQEARKRLYEANKVYIMASIMVVFLVSFFAREVITILLDPRYLEAYKIVPLIALSYLFAQLGGLLGYNILQAKKTKAIMYISLFAAVLNILLNFLLVPRYGAYGAAYATIISFVIPTVVQYQYAKKCYFIPWDWKEILPPSVLLVVIVALFFFIIDINIYISLGIKILITSPIIYIFLRRYHIVHFGNKAAVSGEES